MTTMTGQRGRPRSTASSKTSHAVATAQVRPWVRFFARNLDLILFSFIAGLIISLIKPMYVLHAGLWFTLFIFLLWFLIEPIFLCTLGTTFGKWLLRVHVLELNGQKPGYVNALRRSFMVWSIGYAIGLPIISIGTLIWGYVHLITYNTTLWDKDRFVVKHGEVGYVRGGIAAAIYAVVLGLGIYSTYQANERFTTNAVQHDVDEINKQLPTMVDKDTELNQVSLDGNVVNYDYKLVNTDIKQLDVPIFTQAMHVLIVKQVCNNLYSLQLLENGYAVSFNYADKNNQPVTKIPLSLEDCHAP